MGRGESDAQQIDLDDLVRSGLGGIDLDPLKPKTMRAWQLEIDDIFLYEDEMYSVLDREWEPPLEEATVIAISHEDGQTIDLGPDEIVVIPQ